MHLYHKVVDSLSDPDFQTFPKRILPQGGGCEPIMERARILEKVWSFGQSTTTQPCGSLTEYAEARYFNHQWSGRQNAGASIQK